MLAFDSETGVQQWLYQPPPFCANCFHGLRVDRALEGNQLLVKDIEKVGNEFGSVVTNLQVPLNSSGAPLSDPFAGYGPESNTDIGALYPPSCYISYIVSDPVSGLLTIIQPDFGGPSCGQGFAASMSSSSTSSVAFGPTPGLASVVIAELAAANSIWFTPPPPRRTRPSITVHFGPGRKSPGNSVKFLQEDSPACSEDLGLHDCSDTRFWLWNVEIETKVLDDASKWKVKQSFTGRNKGFAIDPNGNLKAFVNNLKEPDDDPVARATQQPAGQKVIFALDAPGHFYDTFGQQIDSITHVQNFITSVCRNVRGGACFSLKWYLKLVVNPGTKLDRSKTKADFGATSIDF